MLDGILLGLQTVLSWHNLLLVFAGCATGTLIGMLPGLGPITAIALMIPITYGFDPASGMILPRLLTATPWPSRAKQVRLWQPPPMLLSPAAPSLR
jgi:TctA family transporter